MSLSNYHSMAKGYGIANWRRSWGLAVEGGNLLTTVLNFSVFNRPKPIQTPLSLLGDFGAEKT